MRKFWAEEDLLVGTFFIVVSAGAAYFASGCTLGSAAQMGPGFLPTLLAVCLASRCCLGNVGQRPGRKRSRGRA